GRASRRPSPPRRERARARVARLPGRCWPLRSPRARSRARGSRAGSRAAGGDRRRAGSESSWLIWPPLWQGHAEYRPLARRRLDLDASPEALDPVAKTDQAEPARRRLRLESQPLVAHAKLDRAAV